MRRLTVRLLVNVFDLAVNRLFGDTSTPLKPPWNYKRYKPVSLTKDLSDQSVGIICIKGKGQGPNQVRNLNYWWIQHLTFKSSTPGESAPPPPRTVFGRDELIEQIVHLADSLTPIALLGAGGIGKTSIALAVLHDSRIKQRFGEDCRFIRCDQFPASHVHLLNRLSKVIGAGIENPEDLIPLRPFLSSKEMFIILDNAESILDPAGTNAEEIYTIVEELSHFKNICLCITSRISTIPPDCETLDIPTLSMEAACNTFYRIYKHSQQSDAIDNILKQLDFHPLSITLLATVAHQNKWDACRLTREWGSQRTDMLQTDHKRSLAATIELSLASPMFQELGPDARALLEVVAFFPQGVDENKLDWLFPMIPNRKNMFDKFCVLSLTYRSGSGFATMLAPLRDYLCPKTPELSPLLCATKENYFCRLVANQCQHKDTDESQWITLEDVNVEHLLGIFTSVDANSTNVWDACTAFLIHLQWHKQRLVILGSRIEHLPDNHPSKPECLRELSQLYCSVGQYVECKRLEMCILKLWREQGNNHGVAQTLSSIAETDHCLHLFEEAIVCEKEALGIYKQLGSVVEQTDSLQHLALLFVQVKQVDAAKEAASQAINLSSGKLYKHQYLQHHHILGHLHEFRGEAEAAVKHFITALWASSSCNRDVRQRQTGLLRCLLNLFLEAERFDEAQAYLEILKLSEADDPYCLDRLLVDQAYIQYGKGRFRKAKSELSHIIGTRERAGTMGDLLEDGKIFLQVIEVGARDLGDTVEEATPYTISLPLSGPSQSQICEHYYILGHMYNSRGKTEVAISHLEAALEIATSLNLKGKQASIIHYLVHLYLHEDRLDDAKVYQERLRQYEIDVPFSLDSKVAKYLFVCFTMLYFFL